jgi:hypothetical protein
MSFNRVLEVIANDNEENALAAIRTLVDIHKTYKAFISVSLKSSVCL